MKYKSITIEWRDYSTGNNANDPSFGYWTWTVKFAGEDENTVYGSASTPQAAAQAALEAK